MRTSVVQQLMVVPAAVLVILLLVLGLNGVWRITRWLDGPSEEDNTATIACLMESMLIRHGWVAVAPDHYTLVLDALASTEEESWALLQKPWGSSPDTVPRAHMIQRGYQVRPFTIMVRGLEHEC